MINGVMLRDALISAFNNLSNYCQQVDALNVFPVPDGDTGTNMSMTMGAAAREVASLDDDYTISKVADIAASALLRGARGNSGVILSLIFRGISKGLKDKSEADALDISRSVSEGVKAAYNAVMKPTEGTILTVIRVSSESASENAQAGGDPVALWTIICDAAAAALEKTPEQLPVLKKAGVVDAGGQGLLYILLGMKSVFDGNGIMNAASGASVASPAMPKQTAIGSASADIEFGYCSEFIIEKDSKCKKEPLSLRAFLESIGDCVVVVDDESIVKVHVHSNQPGNVIQAALEYGQLINIKIDNMRFQHKNLSDVADNENEDESVTVAAPENEYGFVAVAAGEGLQSLFVDLGVDNMVKGGQTMNPSTDDILKAVMSTPAKCVFVLPNNKNIILAAEQVIPLVNDREVRVLQTKTIPQGISALLAFNDTADIEENHLAMMEAVSLVSTAMITFAARDSSLDDTKIKKGQILGISNGKIKYVEDDMLHVAYTTTRHLIKKFNANFVTLYYGDAVTEAQANQVKAMIENKFGSQVDVTVINGGQPVYYFIVSVE